MKQKHILFFSCEPGGAEVLIPVIRLVQKQTDCQVIVLGYGLGADRFAVKGIEYVEIAPVPENDFSILEAYRPDLIITSAASLPERDMSEKYLWKIAKREGIPTFVFLDQWQNYAARFSGASENERLAYMPDYINCIDEIGETEMVREGFDSRLLVKFGHPYLSSIMDSSTVVNKQEIKRKFNIDTEHHVMLFVSEAIAEHFGHSRGYDQYDSLRLFFELISKSNEQVKPLIKLHPKDTPIEYEYVLAEYERLHPILVANELTAIECLMIADKVFGMTSVMLIEAFVLGKNVISLQPGQRGEDLMVLSRLGMIQKITSSNARRETVFQHKMRHEIHLGFEFKTETFLRFMGKLLNGRVCEVAGDHVSCFRGQYD